MLAAAGKAPPAVAASCSARYTALAMPFALCDCMVSGSPGTVVYAGLRCPLAGAACTAAGIRAAALPDCLAAAPACTIRNG